MSDEQFALARLGNVGINAPAAGAKAGPGGSLAAGGPITCNGVNCGSATYQMTALEALKEAGDRAARDTSTFMISSAAFATAYVSTYALPAAIAVLGTAARSGPAVTVIFRAQQFDHAMRSEPGHNTPLGTPEQVKAAVSAAVTAGAYTVGAGGIVKGTAYIQGVAHEFTGFMRTAGEMVFSDIYRK